MTTECKSAIQTEGERSIILRMQHRFEAMTGLVTTMQEEAYNYFVLRDGAGEKVADIGFNTGRNRDFIPVNSMLDLDQRVRHAFTSVVGGGSCDFYSETVNEDNA